MPEGTTEESKSAKGAVNPASPNAKVTVGRNGVAIASHAPKEHKVYRTYEVYQRERVGQSTPKLKPGDLRSTAFLADPYPLFDVLREDYPCYRDWSSNGFWVSQYNDVTSIFADDANFETRSKLWYYNLEDYGRDFRQELPVLEARARGMDNFTSQCMEEIINGLTDGANLAMDMAAKLPLMILAKTLDVPDKDLEFFAQRYWQMQRGVSWDPIAQKQGAAAMAELSVYFDPLVAQRRSNPGEDLISAIASLEDHNASGRDVTVTLLEDDHQTLHGALANMWALLLSQPDQLEILKGDRRLIKFAYLETLRHSAPVLFAQRFARHEVERFGRLLPQGALILCAAGAANRDPRIYKDPQKFDVERKDLCQREPRGQYRADGLAAGIAFGLGKPSIHPAIPEDRPRSLYALTRDAATTASTMLLEAFPNISLQKGANVQFRCLRWGEMHTCWQLSVSV